MHCNVLWKLFYCMCIAHVLSWLQLHFGHFRPTLLSSIAPISKKLNSQSPKKSTFHSQNLSPHSVVHNFLMQLLKSKMKKCDCTAGFFTHLIALQSEDNSVQKMLTIMMTTGSLIPNQINSPNTLYPSIPMMHQPSTHPMLWSPRIHYIEIWGVCETLNSGTPGRNVLLFLTLPPLVSHSLHHLLM